MTLLLLPSQKNGWREYKTVLDGDLGQLRDDEAELVFAEELPESQSLKGAVHQLLNALQRRLLIDLGFSCGTAAGKHYSK